jgi:glycosyltransferase involved in cell wall biosynthesis
MTSVCILLHNHYEVDLRVKRKAEALVAAGYDVDILALRSSYSKGSDYDLDGVHIYTIDLGKKRGSLLRYFFEYAAFFLWAFYKVSVLMRKKRYLAIDVNNLPDFLVFAALYPKWKKAKIVLDMHEVTPEFYMSKYGIKVDSMLVRLLKYIERISFNFADYVINIDQPIEELLASRGLPRSKSTIITNSVDEEFFEAAESTPVSFKDMPQADFVMMYHGTVTHIYGLDIAIEAFSKAHQDMPGAEFWILGKGSEMSSLQQLTRELGLESKVKFVGLLLPKEIPHWLKRCDIGVLATRQDVFLDLSFSSKLSEYIITGKAVIASRLKSTRHYFSNDALAFFEPHDSADLAKQMLTLYKDPARRSHLAAQARHEFAPLRWGVMRQRYLTLMGDITGHGVPDMGEAKKRAYSSAVSITS